MNDTYRQIVRHAGIFGAGAILSRLASIVLLPLYANYLRPIDYGVMALIDLTVNLLAIVASAGMAAAATRAHFDDSHNRSHDRVWWTAVVGQLVVASSIVIPAFALRTRLATVIFGAGLPQGADYFGIALANLWVASITGIVDAYFRARKASSFVVGIGLIRLLVNIALNVTFLVVWRMGVLGVLWGNLISAVIAGLIQFVPFVLERSRVLFDWRLARTYWRFGWPLIVYGLLSAMMHEADRYILRLYLGLSDVGLYSLAYQIGQAVNTLVMVPFSSIWAVLIYEIAREPDAKTTYSNVFKQYVFGLSLVLLTASIFARPILALIAPPEYAPAADIVPVVCLAYLFFSIHDHFKVPAMLASRTVALLPAVTVAVAVNIGLNFVLIPRLGALGAAWTSVVTFALFAFVGLVRNRRIDRYPYPFAECGLVVAGMAATYAAHRMLRDVTAVPVHIGLAAAACLSWAVFLFGTSVRQRILRTDENPALSVFSRSVIGGAMPAASPRDAAIDDAAMTANINER